MRNHETEVKIRITDLKATRKRLQQKGFRQIHRRSLEDNLLLDTPDRALRNARSILRLRHYGSRWWLTYKGTPASDPFYKSRMELESEVENPEVIRSILEALGFHPLFRYQKYRTQYVQAPRVGSRGGFLELTLDETPIGDFIELEGSRAGIDRVARQLGYSRTDYSTASYGGLYLEECRRRNIPPTDMVFEPPSRRKRTTIPKVSKGNG